SPNPHVARYRASRPGESIPSSFVNRNFILLLESIGRMLRADFADCLVPVSRLSRFQANERQAPPSSARGWFPMPPHGRSVPSWRWGSSPYGFGLQRAVETDQMRIGVREQCPSWCEVEAD